MKPQEDKIGDLFRNNQHKLAERPSLQAWNKLERRLDQKERSRHRPTISIYAIVMMAAAAVALIFFVTTIANIAQEASSRNAVVIYENAPTESIITKKLAAEQAFREIYQADLDKTVAEGTTVGRLKVSVKGVRPYLVPRRS